MAKKNQLLAAPPYSVEQALKQLGANLRTARIRRKLTIREVAQKIGTGPRAVADAEKGQASTGIVVYLALLWVYDLLEQVNQIAHPAKDETGMLLALAREPKRARSQEDIDNDF